jgi:cytochrome P450
MEAQLTVQQMLRRLENLRADGNRELVRAAVLKGFETLPVAWD